MRVRGGICFAVFVWSIALGQTPRSPGDPHFTSDGRLIFPADYREWVFLSSGLGMSYTPGNRNDAPSFGNVFVNREAYRTFLNSGHWPDKTILILEFRESQSKGSINQAGRFQADTQDVEAHVKDKRFPGGWAFFGFDKERAPAQQIPASASCYSCHREHAAVDTTFVQFYPTLLEVAREKHTIDHASE